jgi:hypothetical protein
MRDCGCRPPWPPAGWRTGGWPAARHMHRRHQRQRARLVRAGPQHQRAGVGHAGHGAGDAGLHLAKERVLPALQLGWSKRRTASPPAPVQFGCSSLRRPTSTCWQPRCVQRLAHGLRPGWPSACSTSARQARGRLDEGLGPGGRVGPVTQAARGCRARRESGAGRAAGAAAHPCMCGSGSQDGAAGGLGVGQRGCSWCGPAGVAEGRSIGDLLRAASGAPRRSRRKLPRCTQRGWPLAATLLLAPRGAC